jgi:hypothetical protein
MSELAGYNKFQKLLAEALWMHAGALLDSPTTCAIHYVRMFRRMPILAAWGLFALAKRHEELHPEREAQIEALLLKRLDNLN